MAQVIYLVKVITIVGATTAEKLEGSHVRWMPTTFLSFPLPPPSLVVAPRMFYPFLTTFFFLLPLHSARRSVEAL